jgi:type I restriction enzyme M protein
MLAPYKGQIFDPCCGSGGMLVQGWKFIEEHGGKAGEISIYGQELILDSWRIAFMNLAIQGININFDIKYGDSLRADLHPDLAADYILANPPFNVSHWGREELKNDQRWKYGLPPAHNASFAWIQHIIHHLAPQGLAGFIMSYNSMSSSQANEKEIRRNIIEADLVDCIVALPGQLFYSTQIPVCLWFLTRDKKNDGFRSRQGETLFIDARAMGAMINRVHRELTDEDINRIAAVYHSWRGDLNSHHSAHTPQLSSYTDMPDFCKSARLEDIRQNDYILTPGAYVGSAKIEKEEPFEDKMKRLTFQLKKLQKESSQLDEIINNRLQSLGFGDNHDQL